MKRQVEYILQKKKHYVKNCAQKKRKTLYLAMVFITSPRSFSSSDGDFVRPNVLNTKWVVRVRTEESSPGERWLCYNTIRLDMRPLYYVQPLSKILLGSRQASGLHEADINQIMNVAEINVKKEHVTELVEERLEEQEEISVDQMLENDIYVGMRKKCSVY